MENVLSALIVVGVIALSILGLTERSLASQAAIAGAVTATQARQNGRSGTAVAVQSAASSAFGDYLDVTLQNTGRIRLANFERWDVIVQYKDGAGAVHVNWFAYPAQWTRQILASVSPPAPEVIEPGILNPGEFVKIQVNVAPPVGTGTTNLVTVSTPNGISASTIFTR